MPAKSPEAVARKKSRQRERRAEVNAARLTAKAAAGHVISKTDPVSRRAAPPVMSRLDTKDQLRAFLAQAVRNTAGAPA